jgi:hypothetical protein
LASASVMTENMSYSIVSCFQCYKTFIPCQSLMKGKNRLKSLSQGSLSTDEHLSLFGLCFSGNGSEVLY